MNKLVEEFERMVRAEETIKLFERMALIKAAMALPDPRKLKNGTYGPKTNEWIVATPDIADIFETHSSGFGPSPVELKSFKQWNKEQMEKKTRTLPA